MTAYDTIQDGIIQHKLMLLRFLNYNKAEFIKQLNTSDEQVVNLIFKSLRQMTGTYTLTEKARWDKLSKEITDIRKKYFDEFKSAYGSLLNTMISKEISFIKNLYENAIPVKIELKEPDEKEKSSILPYALLIDKTFEQWFNQLQYRDNVNILNSIKEGYRQGLPIDEIISDVEGRRRLNFRDGEFNKTRNNVGTVIMSTGLAVAGLANELLRTKNANYFQKWFYDAILDSRTSQFCLRHNARIFPEGDYNPVPPNHDHCRSSQRFIYNINEIGNAPMVRVGENRYIKYDFAKEARLKNAVKWKDLSVSQKQEIIKQYKSDWIEQHIGKGYSPDATTAKWFASQSDEFQKVYLGNTKYKMYKDGGLDLNSFISSNGQPLTINELYKLYGEQFEKSIINY